MPTPRTPRPLLLTLLCPPALLLLLLPACRAEVKPQTPEALAGPDQVVEIGEDLVLSAGDSRADRYTWDFGDGAAASGEEVRHAWAAIGTWTVRLTAAFDNPDGTDTDTDDAQITVVGHPLPAPPRQSGRLQLDAGRLYAAVPDADQVIVLDVSDRTAPAILARLDVCDGPVSISVTGADTTGMLAVACRRDQLQLWDTGSLSLVAEAALRWGARPAGIVFDPDTGALYAALEGTGEVVRLDPAGGAPDWSPETVAQVPGAKALAAGGGAIYAARFLSPPDTDPVDPGAAGEVWRIDPGRPPVRFALPPDPGPDSDTDARGLPDLLGALALRPDGAQLIVGGRKANMARGLWRDGLPLTSETASRAMLRGLDPLTGEQQSRALFDNRDRVGAIAWTPRGDRLLVAHIGAQVIDILDPVRSARIGGWQGVGTGLDGIQTDGATAWVLATWDRQIIAYDLQAGNDQIELSRTDLLQTEPLPPEVLAGGRLFHAAGDPRMSQDAYLSCASCHPDGGGDGRTWDFTDRGEGLRNTLPLWAMPPDGPFHWTANFDELQDFENDIRLHQGGAGFLSAADWSATQDTLGAAKAGLSPDLDALAAWMQTLADETPRSPWRAADGSPTGSGARGAATFDRLGCPDCHPAPRYTDAAWTPDGPLLHDVGTLTAASGQRMGAPLTGLRTPGLRGLHASGPWLHDGSAVTLEDAIASHGIDIGGAELDDLVQFLLELE